MFIEETDDLFCFKEGFCGVRGKGVFNDIIVFVFTEPYPYRHREAKLFLFGYHIRQISEALHLEYDVVWLILKADAEDRVNESHKD